MSGVRVVVDDKELQVAINRLNALGSNTDDLLADIGEQLLNSTVKRFDSATDPDGNKWEELAPATKQAKQCAGKPADALVRDMYLRDTLAYQISGDDLFIGSNLVYAATHQLGDDRRNIPARAFLGIGDDDKHNVIALVNRHLDDILSGR